MAVTPPVGSLEPMTTHLLYALEAALRAADIIASTGVITHPLDDGVRGFYARWGFQTLRFDPRRAMMARMEDLRRSFGSGAASSQEREDT